MTAILSCEGLDIGYGQVPVVRGLDIEVHAGEVVALLGPNGAGKTTTLLGLSGALPVSRGRVFWDGQPVSGALHRRVKNGMSLVTEDRSVIMGLSVKDNLRLARTSIDGAVDIFPELRARLSVKAGNLSGGEQQMLTLARALARSPRVLLADELSMGLAPMLVQRLLTVVRAAATEQKIGALIVEQHVTEALRFADRAYVMVRGGIRISGTCAEVRDATTGLEAAYLGMSAN
jgi:branched-chain amino acid transport system ATP-binding protein